MAHGLNSVLRRGPAAAGCKGEGKSGIGSRRIFAPHFKLQVLDSYRNDADCKGNQRATARKYGIHRRQIQKWLQCENSLRNSVGKGKTASPEARKCGAELSLRSGQHRQRDDSDADAFVQSPPGQEARGLCHDAYCRSPVGPDTPCPDAYSQKDTHALCPSAYCHNPSGPDALCQDAYAQKEARVPTLTPLDYTTHSRSHAVSPADPGAPMDLSFKRPVASGEASAPVHCPPLQPRNPSPLDAVSLIQPHPDIWDLSVRSQKRSCEDSLTHSPNLVSPVTKSLPKPVKLFKPYLDDLTSDCQEEKPRASEIIPPCCNRFIPSLSEDESQYYNNNNNHITHDYTYTLHELQPKNTINYFYTINKNCIYTPECEGIPYCTAYDNNSLLQHASPPLKQRQSYSLDFKLSAIECYYQDSMCRGNQRAVASKYNIHRRQVQKWLKQEDELRTRNETTKHMSVVR